MRAFLLILLTLSTTIARAQPETNRFERAYAASDFAAAARIAADVATRHPESSVWAYNAACASARAGDLDAARTWITAAADRGFQGLRSLETDTDLDPIRDTPEFTAALATVRAAAAARLDAFKRTADGYTPPTFVPDDLDTPAPLIIALHGTGGRGQEMLDAWKDAASAVGAILICPDALREQGPGYAWTFRDESEWLIARTLERALADHPIDPARIILTGFSQGANTAIPLGLAAPSPFLAVIPIAGHYEPQLTPLPDPPAIDRPDDQPAPDTAARTPRFYFLIGARDPWSATFRAAHRDFTAAGLDSRLEVVPAMGHTHPAGPTGTTRLTRALHWCLRAGEVHATEE